MAENSEARIPKPPFDFAQGRQKRSNFQISKTKPDGIRRHGRGNQIPEEIEPRISLMIADDEFPIRVNPCHPRSNFVSAISDLIHRGDVLLLFRSRLEFSSLRFGTYLPALSAVERGLWPALNAVEWVLGSWDFPPSGGFWNLGFGILNGWRAQIAPLLFGIFFFGSWNFFGLWSLGFGI